MLPTAAFSSPHDRKPAALPLSLTTFPTHLPNTNTHLLVLECLQLLHLLLSLQPLLGQTSCLLLQRLHLTLKRTRAGRDLVGEKKGKQCQAVTPRDAVQQKPRWWVRSPEKQGAVRNNEMPVTLT